MTFQDLVNGALRSLGVIAAGESPSTEESNDALAALNDLVASWTALGMPIYEITRDATVTLTGAASYELTTRPVRIKSAAVIAANGTAMPVQLVPSEKWSAIQDKTRTGIFAEALFCDYAFPDATVYLSPKPGAGTLELFVYRELASDNALADTVSLPPGYQRALRFNLAVDLAGEYGRAASPELVASAAESKNAITNLNAFVLGETVAAAPPPAA